MNMQETLNESNKKQVTGTFHFKVKTKSITLCNLELIIVKQR